MEHLSFVGTFTHFTNSGSSKKSEKHVGVASPSCRSQQPSKYTHEENGSGRKRTTRERERRVDGIAKR